MWNRQRKRTEGAGKERGCQQTLFLPHWDTFSMFILVLWSWLRSNCHRSGHLNASTNLCFPINHLLVNLILRPANPISPSFSNLLKPPDFDPHASCFNCYHFFTVSLDLRILARGETIIIPNASLIFQIFLPVLRPRVTILFSAGQSIRSRVLL